MDVLGVLRLRRWKEKQPRHPEFGHDIARRLLFHKLQRDALSESFDLLQSRPGIPGKRRSSISNDVAAPDPHVSQTGADEGGAQLTGNDFGFRQFRHARNSP